MNPQAQLAHSTLLHAAMVVDADAVASAPGAILLQGGRITAAGSPQSIGSAPPGTAVVRMPRALLMPALVNAHCHLDLSHVGPARYTGDFTSWVDMIRSRRAATSEAVSASVAHGVALSRAGGTALIGDIAGVRSLTPVRALRAAGLAGVSYVELFGLGRRQADAIGLVRAIAQEPAAEESGVRLGLQPHAPYSCGREVYQAAAESGMPLATHLAETLDELEFVRTGEGPLNAMLRRLGVWDDSITGSGLHSIDHLGDILARAPFLAAHLNYVDDRHLELMASWPLTVAYCPRASAYFGHPHGREPAHRHRDMLDAGVRVALGTDSLVCLDTPERISVLDEMRYLYRRDGADPLALLAMATTHGAAALGFEPSLVTLSPGRTAGIIAIEIDSSSSLDPMRQALAGDGAPQWVVGPVMGADL